MLYWNVHVLYLHNFTDHISCIFYLN
jgi:hypothetical protein